jgi:hypothetical protein
MKIERIPPKAPQKTSEQQMDFDFDQPPSEILPPDKESQPDYKKDHDWSGVKPKKRWIH